MQCRVRRSKVSTLKTFESLYQVMRVRRRRRMGSAMYSITPNLSMLAPLPQTYIDVNIYTCI